MRIVGKLMVTSQSRGGIGVAMFEEQLCLAFGVRLVRLIQGVCCMLRAGRYVRCHGVHIDIVQRSQPQSANMCSAIGIEQS
jgi:hypothetical protein